MYFNVKTKKRLKKKILSKFDVFYEIPNFKYCIFLTVFKIVTNVPLYSFSLLKIA